MATALYRLGHFAFNRRWLVVLAWIALLGIVGIGASQLSGPTSEAFTIPGTQSQKAIELLEERTGAAADDGTARVVFEAPDGTRVDSTPAENAIESAISKISGLAHVTSVTDPFTTGAVSPDGGTAIASVTYDVQAAELTADDQGQLFDAGDSATSAGLAVDYGGDAAAEKVGQSPAELIGLAVA